MKNVIHSFNPSKKYNNHIKKCLSKDKFYRNKDGILISREYAENELGPNSYNDHWNRKPEYAKPKKYESNIINFGKKLGLHGKRVLEVGAGFGTLAIKYINTLSPKKYSIYEFSDAIDNMPKMDNLVTHKASFKHIENFDDFDVVIDCEILEHIQWDTNFLSKIRPKTHVLFSVPTKHAYNHVRAFLLPESIIYRYGSILDIKEINAIFSKDKKTPKWWAVCSARR